MQVLLIQKNFVQQQMKLNVDTIIGNVNYNDKHYSVQNLVTGQWTYNDDGTWTQNIIANTQVPDCPGYI